MVSDGVTVDGRAARSRGLSARAGARPAARRGDVWRAQHPVGARGPGRRGGVRSCGGRSGSAMVMEGGRALRLPRSVWWVFAGVSIGLGAVTALLLGAHGKVSFTGAPELQPAAAPAVRGTGRVDAGRGRCRRWGCQHRRPLDLCRADRAGALRAAAAHRRRRPPAVPGLRAGLRCRRPAP